MDASHRTPNGPDLWYLRRNGMTAGPHALDELGRMLERGAAEPTDRVWRKGAFVWRSLGELVGEVPRRTAPAAAAEPPRRGYFARHWHGELSLGVSYWVNVVLLGLAWAGATALLGLIMTRRRVVLEDSLQAALFLTAFAVVPLLVLAWQVVGTWRSGSAHVARGGRRAWAVAAKVMLVLAVLRVTIEYAGSTIPITAKAWGLAIAMARLPPAEFTALRGGREIEFRGGVHAGTAEQLRRILDQHPQARLIHLESPGGNLAQGRAMAALVRRRNLDTYVRGLCASSCTIIFMAGRERWLKEGASLGFHAPSSAAIGKARDGLLETERQRLLRSGVPDWFVARILAVQGGTLWVPTVEELTRARVITATTNGSAFSRGSLLVPVEAMAAEGMVRAVALGRAVEAVDPALFRRLAAGLRDLMNDGGTDDDWGAMLERTVAPLYRRLLPLQRDDVAVFLMQRRLELIRGLAAEHPELCRDWLLARGTDRTVFDIPALTAAQREALVQTMAEVLIAGADPQLRATPPPQAPPQFDTVRRRLGTRLPPAQMAVLDNPGGPHAPATGCRAAIEMFTEALRLPEREAGPLLRHLFADR